MLQKELTEIHKIPKFGVNQAVFTADQEWVSDEYFYCYLSQQKRQNILLCLNSLQGIFST